MKQGITILFTGIRGTEIPLLYYASKHYEDKGFEKLLINCHMNSENDFDKTYEKAKEIIKSLDLSKYEKVIFIAKSVGTVISCKIKEELNLKADLILFTPLEQTLPYIRKDNDIILVAAGDQDKFLQSEKLVAKCEAEKVNYYIEKGVGHRMEATNDLNRCLEVVGNVLGRLQNNNYVSRTEAKEAFENLRMQAVDLPEMSLEEINAEIAEARAER